MITEYGARIVRPRAYSVTTSVGFVIVLVGTILVLFGGALSLRSDDEDFF